MGTSLAESSVFSVDIAVLGPVITLVLAVAIFGFYVLLFLLSTYFLSKHKSIFRRKLHLVWTTALFFITTFGGLINAASSIMDTVVLYTALQTQDFQPFINYSSHDKTQTAMLGITYTFLIVANCIADSVLIHRCYLVWGSKKRIVILPILASIITNIIGLVAVGMRTKGVADTSIESNFQLYLKGNNYQLAFYYANSVVNFVITLMIAGRIWWVGRQTQALIDSSRETRIISDKYKAVIAISLECGILYPLSLIAHAAVEGNTDKISIPVNLTPVVIQLAGIAPTLIIVRTCFGKSITEKVVSSQGTSSTFRYDNNLGSSKIVSNVHSVVQTQTALHSDSEIRVEEEKTTRFGV
ncbi:hypothetical protein K435DRAFT_724707 [Dendrothele bispora CBS 962.96]|uniref:G-protein coupled receptors family 1 profile domain-containing protein n=1 Tax=Dendrothele bispora (strain CBS 962.96) TaxID=1314807 RepID=A0A4S8LXC4_DENBC|nr:hypothetical protein K435DRAFT_724707 [Dendrothele bispora CBS 962.96]